VIIQVGGVGGDPKVQLLEQERFDDFHIEASPRFTVVQIAHALESAGAGSFIEDKGFFISVEWIRGAVGADLDVEKWTTGFNAMLIYAVRKKWYLETLNAVQAHVIFTEFVGVRDA
jgi:hypothetical protein